MKDQHRDTKTALIDEARALFARHGFRGTSIAMIAKKLNITKQALLHHFPKKELLFATVMADLRDRLLNRISQLQASDTLPSGRFKAIKATLADHFLSEPLDAQLVMRELLDQSSYQETNDAQQTWYLRGFLDALVDHAKVAPQMAGLSRPAVFAEVYRAIGEANYFAISRTTLLGMYGKEIFADIDTAYRTLVE